MIDIQNNNSNINQDQANTEILVDVSRVTKVVKGGRKFSFAACVVTGNKNGKVGYGHGKAKEVAEARSKASIAANKKQIMVDLFQNRTIYHDVIGKYGAGKVILRKAKPGTGIIAGGAMRSIFELVGIKDIVAKSLGSTNVYAMILATFDALNSLQTPNEIVKKRNISSANIGIQN